MKRLTLIITSFILFPSFPIYCQSATNMDNGNNWNSDTYDQIWFSWRGQALSYRHAIKTRHDSYNTGRNAIDFYTWQEDDDWDEIGSLHNMTLRGGKVGIGGITEPAVSLDVNGKIKVHDNIMLNDKWLSNDGGSEGIFITSDGKVGVGTSSPSEKFQVGDLFTFHSGGTKFIGYNCYYSGSTKRITTDETSAIQLNSNGDIDFSVAPSGSAGSTITWSSGLKVLNNGKVGMNTSSVPSDGQVAINGKLYATEVEVQTYPWSDYVFKDNYDLMPIDELEVYIKTHHHLPGIPSEKEIKTNGHNLGKMDALLLQRIEELTLYIIQLKNENEILKSRINGICK